MGQHNTILYIFGLFFLLLTKPILAQNILTIEDSLVFLQCAEIPMAEPPYTFSYTESMLDLDHELIIKEKKTISELLDSLSKTPKDVPLIMDIVYNYKNTNDLSNYRTYLEYAYKQCFEKYEHYPDSFEIVASLVLVLQERENLDRILSVLNQYVLNNTKDVRGLALFALHLSTQRKIQKARYFIEQAYLVDPKYPEIYLSAMVCEFTHLLIQVSSIISIEGDKSKAIKNIFINDTFLKKAIDRDGPVTAQMGLDAVQIFAIFYRTILSTMDKQISKEMISLSPSPTDKFLLRAIEKRVKKQLQNKVKSTTFIYQNLCIIEILRGNTALAVDIFNTSGSILAKNADLLRLLSFSYFLKLDNNNAILYLKKALVIQPNSVDLYTLGHFYSNLNQLKKAYQIFDQTEKLNPSDRKAVCAKASIHLKQGAFNKAFHLIDAYPSYLKDDIKAFHLNYFMALVTLAQGNKNNAFKRLKAIHAQSQYKEKAERLLVHFFKKEEK